MSDRIGNNVQALHPKKKVPGMFRTMVHHWKARAYGVLPHGPTRRLIHRILNQTEWAAHALESRLKQAHEDLLDWLQPMLTRTKADEAPAGGAPESHQHALEAEMLSLVLRYLKVAGPRRAQDILHFLTVQQRFHTLELRELTERLVGWEKLGLLSMQTQLQSDWSLFEASSVEVPAEKTSVHATPRIPGQDQRTNRTQPVFGQLEFSIPAHRFESYVVSLQAFLVAELERLEQEVGASASEGRTSPVRATLTMEPVHLHGDGMTAVLQLFTSPVPKEDKLM